MVKSQRLVLSVISHRRPAPQLFATGMAFPADGPATPAQTALFTLSSSVPLAGLPPEAFAVTGPPANGTAVRTAIFSGLPGVLRVAVDVPQAYCGDVTILLAGTAVGSGGQGACGGPSGHPSLSYRRVCGAAAEAASAAVTVMGVEAIGPSLIRGQGLRCIRPSPM